MASSTSSRAASGRTLVAGRVLGIDPGLGVTGYAIVEPSSRGPYVLEAGVIRPKGGSDASMAARLRVLHEGIMDVLETFAPSALALEQIHSHVSHPRTSILMAHARGVIVLSAGLHDTPVFGYAPTRIKKTLTGSGRAPKEQMQHAIRVELGLEVVPEPHDVADACAVALCHYQIARNMRALEGY